MNTIYTKADELSRRDFLSNAARTFLGVSILPVGAALSAEQKALPGFGKAKRVIYLYMRGGMSQLDTFSPKPEAKEIQGETRVIKSSADGIRIAGNLPKMADHMKHVAVIESMSSTQGAHEQGDYYMHTNYQMRGTIQHAGMSGWVARLGGRENPSLPAGVVINGGSRVFGSGYMETKYAPLPIGNPATGLQNSAIPASVNDHAYSRRLELAGKMNSDFREKIDNKAVRSYRDVYDEALRLMKSEDLKAFDLKEENQTTRDRYGDDAFGQGCLLARRLAEHGVKFIEVAHGNWDTHQDNFGRVPDLAAPLDQGMSALLADLESKDMLKDTLVVLATEFGRTPEINNNDGRDHYPKAFTCLLAGGGISGGQIYGKTDAQASEVVENKVDVTDFNATIGHALGLPIEEKIIAANGRPFTLANKGKPITAIF